MKRNYLVGHDRRARCRPRRPAQAWRADDQVFMRADRHPSQDCADVKVVGIERPAEQTRVALDDIDRLMQKAGGSLQDVVKIIVYATGRFRPAVYGELDKAFSASSRSATGIVVAGLAPPELREIGACGSSTTTGGGPRRHAPDATSGRRGPVDTARVRSPHGSRTDRCVARAARTGTVVGDRRRRDEAQGHRRDGRC